MCLFHLLITEFLTQLIKSQSVIPAIVVAVLFVTCTKTRHSYVDLVLSFTSTVMLSISTLSV